VIWRVWEYRQHESVISGVTGQISDVGGDAYRRFPTGSRLNMATIDQATTFKVELRMEPVGECAAELIEEMGIDAADAIDQHTSDGVLGVAVSVSFDPPALEIDLEIETESLSGMHRVLAEVMQVLEDHAGLHQISKSGYAEHARRDPVLA
jgi:hypothetical protein